jgi:hypothetical protein
MYWSKDLIVNNKNKSAAIHFSKKRVKKFQVLTGAGGSIALRETTSGGHSRGTGEGRRPSPSLCGKTFGFAERN